jgi:hypothetical protein
VGGLPIWQLPLVTRFVMTGHGEKQLVIGHPYKIYCKPEQRADQSYARKSICDNQVMVKPK